MRILRYILSIPFFCLNLFSSLEVDVQAFQKTDWSTVRVVSIITPDGRMINGRIFMNPLEQVKNIKYTVKEILKDESGIQLRSADGEYTAVVTHKEGDQQIEELAIVKEGGNVEVYPTIKIPYETGSALQSTTAKALEVRSKVVEGATMYKIGTTNKSLAAESQFWSVENPLDNLSVYAKQNGIPIENLIENNFIITGKLKNQKPFITREAPRAPNNPQDWGGGIEVVVEPNSVDIETFHLIKDLKQK